MKPILHIGTEKCVVMEVIGEDGQKVSEMKITNKDKELPYYELLEVVQC